MVNLFLRYAQALLTQVSQTAVCNRHHSIDAQVCCSLLMSVDQIPSGEIKMTQEHIANILGIRRESVTECAGQLQKAGLICYARGRICILNRLGLKKRACECYGRH